ncbi:MAG: hypothetical protein M1829_000936 [Trizodia sp. TS-e1964]|nr:MAG: hypothetical protein M1829_000936 [Trizodia sp. TS-e1964]
MSSKDTSCVTRSTSKAQPPVSSSSRPKSPTCSKYERQASVAESVQEIDKPSTEPPSQTQACSPKGKEPEEPKELEDTKIKSANPERWSGDSNTLEHFLFTCEVKFRFKPKTFATNKVKVAYCGFFLSGNSAKWYQTLYQNDNEILDDWTEFKTSFRQTYLAVNTVALVKAKLRKLRKTSSVIKYLEEFKNFYLVSSIENKDAKEIMF